MSGKIGTVKKQRVENADVAFATPI